VEGDSKGVSRRLEELGRDPLGSGVEVSQPIADVFTLHGGRVVRCEIGYSDRRKALEAVGLPE
jgi:hypothetical protein